MIQPVENTSANELIGQIDRLLDDLTELASVAEKSMRPRREFYRQVIGLVGPVVDSDSGAVLSLVSRSVEPVETIGDFDRIRAAIESLSGRDANWSDSLFDKTASVILDEKLAGKDSTVLLHPVDSPQQIVLAFAWQGKVSDSSRNLFQGLFAAVAEIVVDFESNLAVEKFSEKQKYFGKLHQFATSLSESVDLSETAITVANFGRNLFSAKRLVVLENSRRKSRVLAVSGAGSVNRRADEIIAIETIGDEVGKSADGKFFFSSDELGSSDTVSRYVEERSQQLAASETCFSVVWLSAESESGGGGSGNNSARIGQPGQGAFSLYMEHDVASFDKSRFFETLRLIEPQVANSLQNARAVSTIPFRRTLVGLRNAGGGFVGSWTRIAISILILAAIISLFVFQRRIVVYAHGELVPESTRFVFAPEEGVLVRLLVVDGQSVTVGESLAKFESRSLELSIQTEIDEIDAQSKLLKSLELAFAAAEVNESASSQIDAITLSGEIKSVEKKIEHHKMRLNQFRIREEALTIKSPIDGNVVAWGANEKLDGRPMKKGDPIIKVVAESNKWYADIQVDNLDVEHLYLNGKVVSEIESSVVIATKPGVSHLATIDSVAEAVVFDPEAHLHTVTFRLLIDETESSEFKTGASVNARFKGGNASLFYSWFYRGIRQLQYQYF